jgi:hypothetical protein
VAKQGEMGSEVGSPPKKYTKNCQGFKLNEIKKHEELFSYYSSYVA